MANNSPCGLKLRQGKNTLELISMVSEGGFVVRPKMQFVKSPIKAVVARIGGVTVSVAG